MQQEPQRPGRLAETLEKTFTTDQFAFAAIRRMFIPLMLDQLFVFFIAMLSTAMVSSSGEAAISAVSMVGPLSSIAMSVLTALATGGAVLVAQARGSGDEERIRVVIGQTILLVTVVGVVVGVLFTTCAPLMVEVLYAQTEPLVREYAAQYMRIHALSYIPLAVYTAIVSVFRGLGESRTSLLFVIVINTAHLVFSFVFITVMGLGVTGSALSYLVARVIGGVFAALWMFVLRNTFKLRARYVLRASRRVLGGILRLGIPMSLEQIMFQAGLLLTQVYIAAMPTATIAANGIAGSAYNLYTAVAFSMTTLVTTVCGQCIGAKRFDLATRYAVSLTRVGRYVLGIVVLVLGPLTPLLLRMYQPTAEALPQIYLALAIGALPMPFLWCDANLPGAAMRAAGDATYVTVVSLVAMWAARVVLGYVLAIPLSLGIAGVWLSLVLEWVFRAVPLRRRLHSGRWLAKAKQGI